MTDYLKLAVQKSGRLHDDSVKLLAECGISLNNGANRLRTRATNFPIEVLFLRDDDIPQYVEDGVADIGIAGENIVAEKNRSVGIVEKLGFGKCRLAVAVAKNETYTGAASLHGKRIATSYPNLLQNFLNQNGVQAEIHEISGSVEIAPGIGLADAICDLVSTGSTLFLNNLKEAEVVLQSQAVLIQNNTLDSSRAALLSNLLFRIQAVKKAKHNKYIMLNAPNSKLAAISSLLPGIKSPTIIPLAQEGWSSLHSVVQEDDFWNIIEKLKQEGAEAILVLPIEKMIV